MDELALYVCEHVLQIVHVNLLVVHYDLDVIAGRDTTHNDTEVDPRAVRCLFLNFLLVLVLHKVIGGILG